MVGFLVCFSSLRIVKVFLIDQDIFAFLPIFLKLIIHWRQFMHFFCLARSLVFPFVLRYTQQEAFFYWFRKYFLLGGAMEALFCGVVVLAQIHHFFLRFLHCCAGRHKLAPAIDGQEA